MKLRLTLHDKGRFQDLFEKYGLHCIDNQTRAPEHQPANEAAILAAFWAEFEDLLGDMFEVTCEEIPDNEVDAPPEPS